MAFDVFIETVWFVLTYEIFRWVIIGLVIGLIFGVLPGLSAPIGMVLFLPLTLSLDGPTAIILLICIYLGAVFGGGIPFLPGPPRGSPPLSSDLAIESEWAWVSTIAILVPTVIAGIVTVFAVIVLSPGLIRLVTAFGSPEYFLVVILGLVLIALISRGSMAKGLIAGFFGLSLTTIGAAPMTADIRYTFGYLELFPGIAFVPVLIGLFAVAGMMKVSGSRGDSGIGTDGSGDGTPGIETAFSWPGMVIKSAFIGMGIGVVPGMEASVENIRMYNETVRQSISNRSVDRRSELQVIAAEASKNGTIGGAVLPAFSFGIPGSAAAAVLIGGLVLHGMMPGTQLLEPNANLNVTYAMLLSLIIGNVLILGLGFGTVRVLRFLPDVDADLVVPLIIVLAFMGGFSLRGEWMDLITVVVFGILGYSMLKYDYSIVAFVVGIVLGPIMEENLFRSLIFSDGPISIFVTQPLSVALLLLIVIVFFAPLFDRKSIKSVLD